jgi:hypothetical protein
LREQVEADPDNPIFLKTLRGVGYLFESVGASRTASQTLLPTPPEQIRQEGG